MNDAVIRAIAVNGIGALIFALMSISYAIEKKTVFAAWARLGAVVWAIVMFVFVGIHWE